MKAIHTIKLQVFAGDEEKPAVKEALLKLLPESVLDDIREKKIIVSESLMRGQNRITVFDICLKKNKHCNDFLHLLASNLKSDDLKEKLCQRIDDFCKCYVRLDKKSLLEGVHTLTYSGSCFHIRMTIAAYPGKKDVAQSLVCEAIDEIISRS